MPAAEIVCLSGQAGYVLRNPPVFGTLIHDLPMLSWTTPPLSLSRDVPECPFVRSGSVRYRNPRPLGRRGLYTVEDPIAIALLDQEKLPAGSKLLLARVL